MKTLRQLIFVLALLPFLSFAQESEIYKFLKAIPGIEIVKKDTTIQTSPPSRTWARSGAAPSTRARCRP